MSEKLPFLNSDSRQYERPNMNWVCGYTAQGAACPRGPDRRGRCLGSADCKPVLEIKEGESKGRWRCTRPGEPCGDGPLPDGRCCRPIVRCSPRPTLRWWRGRITAAIVALSAAVLLIMMGGFWRGAFLNPGKVTLAHTGDAFQILFAGTNRVHATCGACHQAGDNGLTGILAVSWEADPNPLEVTKLLTSASGQMTHIDGSCQKCHEGHLLHQPGFAVGLSCSSCHREHRGPGRMTLPSDTYCALCHAGADRLATMKIENRLAGFSPKQPARPIASNFAAHHPDFRVQTRQMRDTNTLRFNHALHLTSLTVTRLSAGKAMACSECHQPDAAGNYVREPLFEKNCQRCHSLQFDVETPELRLPHGRPEFVSAFLRTLPKQYADLALRRGIGAPEARNKFAQERLKRLQQDAGPGEELERRIFFSNSTLGPPRRIGSIEGSTPAIYAGCAYCHEVTANNQGQPQVTPPVMTQRWLLHGQFDHSSHTTLDCARCHAAAASKETSDIILPTRQSCAVCHSRGGGVVDTCATCHKFHTKTPTAASLVQHDQK